MGFANNSNLRGKVIVLVGGGGFIGTHVAQDLLARGARLRIVSRNPERAFRLRPLGNLGQIQFLRGNLAKPETITPALIGADAVVNLVGIFAGDLKRIHATGPSELAAAARTAGVQSFVHISSTSADANSAVAYAQTKAEGEAEVLSAFPTATILRPTIVFGSDDTFINRFAGLIAMLPMLPVFGPDAKLQPVFVDDVALAVSTALEQPGKFGGKTFDLGGPETITMLELNRRIAAAQGRRPLLISLPDAVSGIFAAATGWMPAAPITSEQWAMLKSGSVADPKLPGFKALGIVPKPLGLFLDRWMVAFRQHGRFGAKASA